MRTEFVRDVSERRRRAAWERAPERTLRPLNDGVTPGARSGSVPAREPRRLQMLHSLRVRWAEVDRQDVVFNRNYFVYFDVAVADYWRTIGLDYPAGYIERHGADRYAVKATAGFHGSARYDDVLDVGCRVSRIGRSSLTFVLGLRRGATHLTSGKLVYVNIDVATRSSKPGSQEFRDAMIRFEKLAPTGA